MFSFSVSRSLGLVLWRFKAIQMVKHCKPTRISRAGRKCLETLAEKHDWRCRCELVSRCPVSVCIETKPRLQHDRKTALSDTWRKPVTKQ